MALTPKQEMFVKEYLIDLNATQAAIRAGYNKNTAYSIGEENLKKPEIQAAIQKAMDERADRTNITADKVLSELAQIAFDDISNYLDFEMDEQTKQIKVTVKKSKEIDTRSISEISLGKDGQFKFKLYCKDNALVQLGKHLGIFNDKLELMGKDGAPIEINTLTPEERNARIEELIAKRGN